MLRLYIKGKALVYFTCVKGAQSRLQTFLFAPSQRAVFHTRLPIGPGVFATKDTRGTKPGVSPFASSRLCGSHTILVSRGTYAKHSHNVRSVITDTRDWAVKAASPEIDSGASTTKAWSAL
jgi:hypothetical protein